MNVISVNSLSLIL